MTAAATTTYLPPLFVPHGSPMMLLDPGAAGVMLANSVRHLPRPRAVVVATAHWETAQPAVGAALRPETIYDFWGFPEELYRLQYPATGSFAVASEVSELLRAAGFVADIDAERGLDHGIWNVLTLMYPQADVPVVPLSVQPQAGPEHHYRLGRALAPLAQQGVLIVGSGNLTHNLYHYRLAGGRQPAYVGAFQQWMAERLAAGDLDALFDYRRQAPGAVEAHPTDEHLLPLYVALGAAGPQSRAERLFDQVLAGVIAMDAYAFHAADPVADPLADLTATPASADAHLSA